MNKKPISLAKAFETTVFAAKATLDGYVKPQPLTPKAIAGYMFQEDLLFDMIVFMKSSNVAFKITGPTGSGKSSFVEQFCNRLNLPLYMTNAKPTSRAQDFVGAYIPTETGGLKFQYGPLVKAALEGSIILIDEYNVLDPAEATGLNDALEGRPIGILETGEQIVPQPGFKVIVTMNPKGPGYRGRNSQDAANDERFIESRANYLPADVEIPFIAATLQNCGMADGRVATLAASQFVEVANMVRNAYMGNSNDAAALEITMSTRTIERWATWFMLCNSVTKKKHDPAHYALERVMTYRASPASRLAIHKMVETVFGVEYLTPEAALLNKAAQRSGAPASIPQAA